VSIYDDDDDYDEKKKKKEEKKKEKKKKKEGKKDKDKNGKKEGKKDKKDKRDKKHKRQSLASDDGDSMMQSARTTASGHSSTTATDTSPRPTEVSPPVTSQPSTQDVAQPHPQQPVNDYDDFNSSSDSLDVPHQQPQPQPTTESQPAGPTTVPDKDKSQTSPSTQSSSSPPVSPSSGKGDAAANTQERPVEELSTPPPQQPEAAVTDANTDTETETLRTQQQQQGDSPAQQKSDSPSATTRNDQQQLGTSQNVVDQQDEQPVSAKQAQESPQRASQSHHEESPSSSTATPSPRAEAIHQKQAEEEEQQQQQQHQQSVMQTTTSPQHANHEQTTSTEQAQRDETGAEAEAEAEEVPPPSAGLGEVALMEGSLSLSPRRRRPASAPVTALARQRQMNNYEGTGEVRAYVEQFHPLRGMAAPGPRDKCAGVVHNDNLFVWGGVHSARLTGGLHAYNFQSSCWKRIQTRGESPSPRHSHTMCLSEGKMIICGGLTLRESPSSSGQISSKSSISVTKLLCPTCPADSIDVLNLATKEWQTVGPSDTLDVQWHRIEGDRNPALRKHHSAVVYEEHMYVFGGINYPDKMRTNSLDILHMGLMMWVPTLPEEVPQNPPPPLSAHSATVFEDSMVVFGGKNTDEDPTNDVYVYNFTAYEWDLWQVAGEAPSPRSGHTSSRCGAHMLVYGGATSFMEFANDLHSLNLKTGVWQAILLEANTPVPGVQYHLAAHWVPGRGADKKGGGGGEKDHHHQYQDSPEKIEGEEHDDHHRDDDRDQQRRRTAGKDDTAYDDQAKLTGQLAIFGGGRHCGRDSYSQNLYTASDALHIVTLDYGTARVQHKVVGMLHEDHQTSTGSHVRPASAHPAPTRPGTASSYHSHARPASAATYGGGGDYHPSGRRSKIPMKYRTIGGLAQWKLDGSFASLPPFRNVDKIERMSPAQVDTMAQRLCVHAVESKQKYLKSMREKLKKDAAPKTKTISRSAAEKHTETLYNLAEHQRKVRERQAQAAMEKNKQKEKRLNEDDVTDLVTRMYEQGVRRHDMMMKASSDRYAAVPRSKRRVLTPAEVDELNRTLYEERKPGGKMEQERRRRLENRYLRTSPTRKRTADEWAETVERLSMQG
jgi:hypothetical protein